MKKLKKRKTRKKLKLTRSRLIYIMVCVLVFGGFLVTIISQQQTLSDIYEEQAYYEEANASEKEKLEAAERDEAYSSSDEFYENKARDEGYVREDEVQFIVGN